MRLVVLQSLAVLVAFLFVDLDRPYVARDFSPAELAGIAGIAGLKSRATYRRFTAADQQGALGTSEVLNRTLSGLVEIPGGPFVMGAAPPHDPQAFDNERWSATQPTGVVDVPSFYIGRHEVTREEFGAFARARSWSVDPRALNGEASHPVTFVSWTDALAYGRWLQQSLVFSSATPMPFRQLIGEGWKLTLPTEAEWEKAARGTDGRIYPWGNEVRTDVANFAGTGTMAVGERRCPDCAHGLADMSGNVWEWTRSPYQPYPYNSVDDRSNLEADALWVMRGGHFGDPARLVRASTRGAAEPGARRAFIGFRIALVRAK